MESSTWWFCAGAKATAGEPLQRPHCQRYTGVWIWSYFHFVQSSPRLRHRLKPMTPLTAPFPAYFSHRRSLIPVWFSGNGYVKITRSRVWGSHCVKAENGLPCRLSVDFAAQVGWNLWEETKPSPPFGLARRNVALLLATGSLKWTTNRLCLVFDFAVASMTTQTPTVSWRCCRVSSRRHCLIGRRRKRMETWSRSPREFFRKTRSPTSTVRNKSCDCCLRCTDFCRLYKYFRVHSHFLVSAPSTAECDLSFAFLWFAVNLCLSCMLFLSYLRLHRPASHGKCQPHGVRCQSAPIQSAISVLPDLWPADRPQKHRQDDLLEQIRTKDSICKALLINILWCFGAYKVPGYSNTLKDLGFRIK